VNYIDKAAISRDIELARAQKVDVIIACMHWGEEYKQIPSSAQKEMAMC
jgi:poly-gamma-glutamate synthesis protein (capsule biosynthesis protein)